VSGSKLVLQPSYGAGNLLTDGGVEAWTSPTNLTNWTENLAGTSTVNQETVDIHGGLSACRLDIDASTNAAQIVQTIATSVGAWLLGTLWSKASANGKKGGFSSTYAGFGDQSLTLTTSYAQYAITGIATGAAPPVYVRNQSPSASSSLYFDDISVKEISVPSMIVWRRVDYPVSRIRAQIWRTVWTVKGVIVGKDSNNYIAAFLNLSNRLILIKCVAGTLSAALANVVISEIQGSYLELIPNAAFTAFSVNYNAAGSDNISGVSITDFTPTGTWYAGVFGGYNAGVASDAFDNFRALKV
jgi:hypothetical protein